MGVLLLALFVVLISVGLFLIWLIEFIAYRTYFVLKSIGVLWALFAIFILILSSIHPIITPVQLDKDDIYGKYVIDTDKYPGYQADWQHDHHIIEIKTNDTLTLSILDDDGNIIKKESVKISFNENWVYAPRLKLESDSTAHHIIKTNPTLYRKKYFNFYYVFESERYGNMFFVKD